MSQLSASPDIEQSCRAFAEALATVHRHPPSSAPLPAGPAPPSL